MPETLPKEAELEEESSSDEEQYMLSREKVGETFELKGEEPTFLRGTGEDLCEWVQRILNAAIVLKSDKLFWDEKSLKLYNAAPSEYFKERHKVTANDFECNFIAKWTRPPEKEITRREIYGTHVEKIGNSKKRKTKI